MREKKRGEMASPNSVPKGREDTGSDYNNKSLLLHVSLMKTTKTVNAVGCAPSVAI